MIGRIKTLGFMLSMLCGGFYLASENSATSQENDGVHMQSVVVNNRLISATNVEMVNLGSSPEQILFYFAMNTSFNHTPVRLRYMLNGYDNSWQDGPGEMHLAVRYYSDSGDLINEQLFPVSGNSAGWNGSLITSPLTHRRETLVVPSQASRIIVVISSAGPPATVGIYAIANLVITKPSDKGLPVILLQSPFDQSFHDEATNQAPIGWVRDGINPSMAQIVKLGHDPVENAFGILDDSVIGHAEWHNIFESAPRVTPGDHLVIEWNELFSIGVGDARVAIYRTLPIGKYRFQVEALDLMGVPNGFKTSLSVLVPPPFWKTLWFWGIISVMLLATTMATGRFIILRKVRVKILHLERQRMLEQERVRIAHDIHDDLGARVTQISLLSAMARTNATDLEQARTELDQITQMSRELVAALYETVWAVNPENDNLNELSNYLFQMVNKLCESTPCRCRFYIQDLPREILVPSQIRHNICMAVKETINNVIKHAHASEIAFRMEFIDSVLTISIQDDGCGFQPTDKFTGHGLNNLRRRLKDINGICSIESKPGVGTTIKLCLEVRTAALRE
jgi:signal transduction histidine kinase